MSHLRLYEIRYTWWNAKGEHFQHDSIRVYGAKNRDKKIAEMLASGVEYQVITWLLFTGGWYFGNSIQGYAMTGGHCTKSKIVYEDKEIYRKKVEELGKHG